MRDNACYNCKCKKEMAIKEKEENKMFTKEEIRCLEFVNKWVCGDSISDEDIATVAYADLSGLVQPFVNLIKK